MHKRNAQFERDIPGKVWWKSTSKRRRAFTAPLRSAPRFMIIGAQKCGTTSLYGNLLQHPRLIPPVKKEIHFFSHNYHQGRRWYRSHFPFPWAGPLGKRIITGEASTSYLFNPHAAKRAFRVFPGIKLIALLRNPIDRAYSHYQHTVRLGWEKLSFEEAVESEPERLNPVAEKVRNDEGYYSHEIHHYSYLTNGIYVNQLKAWFDRYDRRQILVLKSEDMFNDPSTTYRKVIEFLGLPMWEPQRYERYNQGQYYSLDPAFRSKLVKHFRLYNRELRGYLADDPQWDR